MTGTVVDGMPLPYSFPSLDSNESSIAYDMILLLHAMTSHVELGEGQGSGWKFHRLQKLTFTVAFGNTRFGVARAIVGGKIRYATHNSLKVAKKKKKFDH